MFAAALPDFCASWRAADAIFVLVAVAAVVQPVGAQGPKLRTSDCVGGGRGGALRNSLKHALMSYLGQLIPSRR